MEEIFYGYIFYFLAATIGISAGYHRYFTHKSFNATPLIETIMLFFGLICGGRSALTWAAVHRIHHTESDTKQDPHSPIYVGMWNVILSRWSINYIPKKYIKDLIKNPRVVFFHKYGRYVHLGYASIIMLIGGLKLLLIFVVIPFVIAWIGFGLLNWIAHKDGTPTDVPIMNILAPGEGWHKIHHDHPGWKSLHKYDIAGIAINLFLEKKK